MKRPTFWRLLLGKAFSVQTVVLAIAGVWVGLFYKPGWSIPAQWVFLGYIGAAFLIALVVSMLFEVWPLLRHEQPRVRSARQITRQKKQQILLLLEPSELFGFDAFVSVYRKNADFEEMIGLGRVLTIQGNGFIQVTIEAIEPATDKSFLADLGAGNVTALSQTIVKPTVPRSYGNLI